MENGSFFNQRKDKTGYSALSRDVQLKKEYETKIQNNLSAWKFFNELSPSYKRDSIWWIMSAKKEETRLRRLNRLIDAWERNEMLRS